MNQLGPRADLMMLTSVGHQDIEASVKAHSLLDHVVNLLTIDNGIPCRSLDIPGHRKLSQRIYLVFL